MKKLDIKAFWIILSGIAGTLVYRAADLVMSRNREFPALAERMDAEKLERLTRVLFGFNLLFTIIFALICVYFIYRLVKNRKEPQGQKYITFLFVLNIIVAVFNVLSLILGNLTALISIAINAAIIVGCAVQRKYEPPYAENE